MFIEVSSLIVFGWGVGPVFFGLTFSFELGLYRAGVGFGFGVWLVVYRVVVAS